MKKIINAIENKNGVGLEFVAPNIPITIATKLSIKIIIIFFLQKID